MRDPARIDRILDRIRELWKAQPDWRLGQLLTNVAPKFEEKAFHFEDDELEARLRITRSRFVSNLGVRVEDE